jgi:galactokinase
LARGGGAVIQVGEQLLDSLAESFVEHFGKRPEKYFIRAPGRVNLMGDHIDYNGLAVLPMAIQRGVTVLSAPRSDATIRVHNAAGELEARTFELGGAIEPYPPGDWGNYVKAAAQTLAEGYGVRRGFDAVVASDLPVASGLSSSSALVVACALALVTANDLVTPPLELMQRLADGERYVGLRGGAMDQAICLGARAHTATRVEFAPLRLTPQPIPEEWRFVVASSLVRADKSGRVRDIYNRRTEECREALAGVASHLGLADRVDSYGALLAARAGEELIGAAEEAVDPTLARRFRHVVTEAQRVERAEQAMAHADLAEFGRITSESHVSLRDDYEVSCPELDSLVEITVSAGAAGARVTGAGLGGCAAAVCHVEQADRILAALHEQFYAERDLAGVQQDAAFVAEPAAGASVATV